MPELRLELPTLHLPSVVRSRRNAEMRVDGGRAPLVSGAPAAFGHLANAGPVGVQQFSTATIPDRSNPNTSGASATPPPGVAPSGAKQSCTPMSPTEQTLNAPADEIIEMRRALFAYQQELERVKRALETTASTAEDPTAERDVPPSPVPLRRLSYPQPRAGVAPYLRPRAPEQIVEAGYTQIDDADDTFEYEPDARTGGNQRTSPTSDAGPRPSAPVKRPGSAPPTPPNIGYSYLADEEPPADGSLGIWKGEGKRPEPRRFDGSAKRSSR